MIKRIKMKMWDDHGKAIGTTKGTPEEIGKKVKSWLEKMK